MALLCGMSVKTPIKRKRNIVVVVVDHLLLPRVVVAQVVAAVHQAAGVDQAVRAHHQATQLALNTHPIIGIKMTTVLINH